MARRELDSRQVTLRENVVLAAVALERRKREVEEELREIRERGSSGAREKLDRAILAAVDGGVPKSHLTTPEVLGTTNPYAVRDAIERVNGTAPAAAPVVRAIPRFTKLENGDIAITYQSFATTSRDPNYPEILAGTVRADDAAISGWEVIEDPTDHGNPDDVLSFVPGILRWEMDRGTAPGSLAAELTEWSENA